MSETEPDGHESVGLFSSLRSALANFLELAHTRLELLSVEMEARLLNSRHVMLWSVVALFSASLAMLMFALTLLIVFWDTHRLLAAGTITAFFALLSVAATLVVRHRVRARPRLLAATIGELKRDVAALDGPR
ncbi:MAG TPA: phage holin family protein [Steroidobacteraceae bacterium]|nr:phage holin family protein [Steroidobacteraceae bacterium]